MAPVTGKRKHEREPVQDLLIESKGYKENDTQNEEYSSSSESDSEESVYSGLEEEESSEEESEDESEEEHTSSDTGEDIMESDKLEAVVDSSDTKGEMSDSEIKLLPEDEYAFDSSDEEDIRNTVGNIPMEWYKEYSHIGYDWSGRKIGRPDTGDELDEFLNKMDNPDYWRTVKDKQTGQNVRLSDEDVTLLRRAVQGKHTDPNQEFHQPWIDFFTHETLIHPVTNHPAQKRSFIPSLWEKKKVGQLVNAIKMGWIKPTEKKKEEEDAFYELWTAEDEPEINKHLRHHIPAPKMPLPGHAESYNPPPEYLFTEEEKLAWEEQDQEERTSDFMPQKYDCLRHVPGYSRFINERFQRSLDLYLCPRQRKFRTHVEAEDLLPKLPKPKDLQPFPTVQSIVYKGHSHLVRTISVDPTGQWLVSGSDDKSIKFWEVSTGRCMKTLVVGGAVKCIAWNPNPSLSLVAAAVDEHVLIINPGLGDKLVLKNTDNMIGAFSPSEKKSTSDTSDSAEWHDCLRKAYEEGWRVKIAHPKAVGQVTWHGKGDYFAVVMPKGGTLSVLIHQLSKRRTQTPFRKSKGMVQCIRFHPIRPFLFVATQRYVRIYNLMKQELTKKLMTNCKWVSSMAVHPGGDNVIVGSYDSKLSWFDLDLSSKPYQTLRHHKKALRQVAFHKRYPLFASCSDDNSIIVCHGMVYNDLMKNPLLVPVKILRGHSSTKNLGVLSCEFHPTQPWIFSSGSDHMIRLFT